MNDILQAILYENKSFDTTNSDWFEFLPEMIRMINEEYVNQTLEAQVKVQFLSLLENCLSVLKPNGYLVMSHYVFQFDLNLDYNVELTENMIPMVRPWLKELSVGNELFFDELDPQWWLIYQK